MSSSLPICPRRQYIIPSPCRQYKRHPVGACTYSRGGQPWRLSSLSTDAASQWGGGVYCLIFDKKVYNFLSKKLSHDVPFREEEGEEYMDYMMERKEEEEEEEIMDAPMIYYDPNLMLFMNKLPRKITEQEVIEELRMQGLIVLNEIQITRGFINPLVLETEEQCEQALEVSTAFLFIFFDSTYLNPIVLQIILLNAGVFPMRVLFLKSYRGLPFLLFYWDLAKDSKMNRLI